MRQSKVKVRQRKDTGGWIADYRDPETGRRIQETLAHVTNQDEADAVASTIQADLLRGHYGFGKKKVRLFNEFTARVFLPYSKTKESHAADKSVCKQLGAYFKGKTLDQITAGAIERYKQFLLSTPIEYGPEDDRKYKDRKPASVNNQLRILSKILSMAVNEGEILKNPCREVPKLPENNQRTRVLSESEERRLLLALDPEVRPIVVFALHTGMRLGEILNLKWEDIDFDHQVLIVQKSKNNRKRAVFLNPTVTNLLRGLDMGGEWVFPSPKTGERRTTIKTAFNAAKTRASINDFKFHDLRHTFATRVAHAGGTLLQLKDLLGHSQISMTTRYAHSVDQALRDAVNRIG